MRQPQEARHPLYAMTTYELRERREELEHAIEDSAPDAAVQNALRNELAAVLGEQDQRAAIRRADRSPS
jgi:hypothetical protein